MSEVLSIDDYVAQGFTRVQAIKKHYEDLKKRGETKGNAVVSQSTQEQLERRYKELQQISDQKGFVQTTVKSMNLTRRLSSRLIDVDLEEEREKVEEEKAEGKNGAEVVADSQVDRKAAVTSSSHALLDLDIPLLPEPEQSTDTKTDDASLQTTESRDGIDDEDPFPQFDDADDIAVSADSEEHMALVHIELQSSEPTTANISSFIEQSDYSEDEIKEFHFLIDQGFNIDEASDLVYQRRLNTIPQSRSRSPAPPYSAAASTPTVPAMHFEGDGAAATVKVPQTMATSTMPTRQVMQSAPPPPYTTTTVGMGPPPPYQPPTSVRRIPIRANALTGNRDADLAQLLDRGYTEEQAHEICEIIYREREEEKHRQELIARQQQEQQQQRQQQQQQHAPSRKGDTIVIDTNRLAPAQPYPTQSMQHANPNRMAMHPPATGPTPTVRTKMQRQASAHAELEALKMALLVSEQEAAYGINMYDSLQPEDEDTIAAYIAEGLTLDEAVFEVFNTKLQTRTLNVGRNVSFPAPSTIASPPPAPPRNILVPVREAAAPRDSPSKQMFTSSSAAQSSSMPSTATTQRPFVSPVTISPPPPYPGPSRSNSLRGPAIPQQTSPTNHSASFMRMPPNAHSAPNTAGNSAFAPPFPTASYPPLGPPLQQQQQQQIQQHDTTDDDDDLEQYDVDYTAAKNIENEIELLMISGYTRESAVRFLLEKAKRGEVSAGVSSGTGAARGRGAGRAFHNEDDLPLPVPKEIQIRSSDHMTVASDLTQSVVVSVRSAANRSAQSGGARGASYSDENLMAESIEEGDEEDDEDYVADLPLDIKRMYPYMGFDGIYNRQPGRDISKLGEEDRALKVGILISQQSATFDTNMYESITDEDEPMINSLLSLGFDEDETYLIIFERKFGPPGVSERSVRSAATVTKKNVSRIDHEIDNASTESMQRILRLSKQEAELQPGVVKVRGPGTGGGGTGGGGGGSGSGSAGTMAAASSAEADMGSRDLSDINPQSMEILVSMGFTRAQVVHALRMNAYDVQSAAQFLLEGN